MDRPRPSVGCETVLRGVLALAMPSPARRESLLLRAPEERGRDAMSSGTGEAPATSSLWMPSQGGGWTSNTPSPDKGTAGGGQIEFLVFVTPGGYPLALLRGVNASMVAPIRKPDIDPPNALPIRCALSGDSVVHLEEAATDGLIMSWLLCTSEAAKEPTESMRK